MSSSASQSLRRCCIWTCPDPWVRILKTSGGQSMLLRVWKHWCEHPPRATNPQLSAPVFLAAEKQPSASPSLCPGALQALAVITNPLGLNPSPSTSWLTGLRVASLSYPELLLRRVWTCLLVPGFPHVPHGAQGYTFPRSLWLSPAQPHTALAWQTPDSAPCSSDDK